MRKTYVVTLSAEERTRLEKLVSTGRTSAKRQIYGRILLKADTNTLGAGWTDEQICVALARISHRWGCLWGPGAQRGGGWHTEAPFHHRASRRAAVVGVSKAFIAPCFTVDLCSCGPPSTPRTESSRRERDFGRRIRRALGDSPAIGQGLV